MDVFKEEQFSSAHLGLFGQNAGKIGDPLRRVLIRHIGKKCWAILLVHFLFMIKAHGTPLTIQKLWGSNPPNYLQTGTLFYHVDHPGLPPIMTRPYLGFTYKSVNFLFTKNCYYDNVFALNLQRNLFSFKKLNTLS